MNKKNIPDPHGIISKAIIHFNEDYDRGESDYTATEIIKPYQMVALTRKYNQSIEEDLSEGLWKLLGSALHLVLEKVAEGNPNLVSEKRFYTVINNIVISGKIDLLLLNEKILHDYKVTNCWHFVFSDFKDYIQQGNINRFILEQNGMSVKYLSNILIFRNWEQSRAGGKYPNTPIIELPLETWDLEETRGFIWERLKKHERAKDLLDEELASEFPCSHEERWWNKKKKIYMRCESYCPCRDFCLLKKFKPSPVNQ